MTPLFTILIAGGGLWLLRDGLRRWRRARFATSDPQLAERDQRGALRRVGLGGAAATVPGLLPMLVFHPHGGPGIVGGFFAFVWALGMLGVLSLVVLGLALTSRTAERAATDVRDSARSLLGLRKRPSVSPAIPGDWAGLLAHDRALTQRFLAYDDLDLQVSFPVMRDYRDRYTMAALQAMLACDHHRTTTAPAGVRDLRQTPYAQAVAHFDAALTAAEANAQRLAWSQMTHAERRTLQDAAQTLEFMRANTTTPAERQAAYAKVLADLDALRAHQAAPASGIPDGLHPQELAGIHAARARAAEHAARTAATSGQPGAARPHPWDDILTRAGTR